MTDRSVNREVRAGDPIYARKAAELRALEDELRHALLDDDARQELEDEVKRLRRQLRSAW